VIYVGIDDTDVVGSPGTNKLARSLIRRVAAEFRCIVAVRHQLLLDRRVPYTAKNSSASILFEPRGAGSIEELGELLRRAMLEWFIEGSDPGLCITGRVPPEVTRFGRRCQQQLVQQQAARDLAAAHDIRLEGLGGTEDGVIGALAAVGLVAGGNDGRVVNIGNHPDELAGQQDVSLLLRRGVAEVRLVDSGKVVRQGKIDVGKRLRPNYRNGQIVLFVEETPQGRRAVRISPGAKCETM